MKQTYVSVLLMGLLFTGTPFCQSEGKKEVTISGGTEIVITGQPKYEKPKSYDSTATTTWGDREYKIRVAVVTVPTEGSFQLPCLETEPGVVYIADSSEMKALLGIETIFREGASPEATDKPVAATLEPLEGKALKAVAGLDGIHIGLDLMSGQMNLGEGLVWDLKTFGRKVIFKTGSLTVDGVPYTFAEEACIIVSEGKLTAYGIKRSQ